MVREAGGLVTDLDNRYAMMTTGDILVANDRLHPALHKLLKGAGGK